MSAGRLVWVSGLRGAVPEKWLDDAPHGVKLGKIVLCEYPLSAAEFALSIAILEQRYPAPEMAVEERVKL